MRSPDDRSNPPGETPGESASGARAGGGFAIAASAQALLVTLLFAALTAYAVHRLAQLDAADSRAALGETTRAAERYLADHLGRYRQLADAAAGFLRAESAPTQRQWLQFAEAAAGTVRDDTAFVALGFLAHEMPAPFAPSRGARFPLHLVAPAGEDNLALLGEDLAVGDELHAAIEAALSRQAHTLSAPLRLYRIAPPGALESLLLLPVFADAGAGDADGDAPELRGLVFVAVRLPELLRDMLASARRPLGVWALDLDSTPPLHLFEQARGLPAISAGDRELDFGGRRHRLSFFAVPPHAGGHGTIAVGVLGGVVSVLLGWHAFVLGRGRERAQRLALTMTRGLRDSERRFALAVEAAAEGIWEWTPQDAHIFLSARCRELMQRAAWPGGDDLRGVLRTLPRAERRRFLASLRAHLAYATPCDVEAAPGARGGPTLRLRAKAELDERGRVVRIAGSVEDVSALREREANIRRSDEFLTRLVDLLPLPLVVRRQGGRRVMANRAARQLFAERGPGARRSLVAGDILPLGFIRAATAGGEVGAREIRHPGPAGESLYLQVHNAVLEDISGEDAQLTVVSDVTELRRAEAGLRASLEEFDALFAHAPLGLALMSAAGVVLRANPACCEIVGVEESALRSAGGRNPLRERVATALGEVAAPARHLGPIDGELQRPDGSRVATRFSLAFFRTERGEERLWGLLQDVTERSRAEAALRESEARFRRLADSAPVLIWMLAPDARVTYLNRTWLEFTGTELGDGLGAGWLVAVHPEDRVRCAAAEHAAIEAARAFGLEFRLRAADGGYRWMIATAEPIFDGDAALQGFIGSATDISELKEAEEALRRHRDELALMVREQTEDLRRAKDAAEAASVAKSQFLANMSHELRTPLHAILSYAKLGETRVGMVAEEKLRGYFHRVGQSGERLLELLNDLLDLAKLEAGRMVLEVAPADLAAIVDEALDEFGALAKARGQRIEWTAPAAPCIVDCDARRIGQVLRNLLSNAVKFTPEGGLLRIVLDTTTQHGRRRQDPRATRFARLAVIDTGVGIPEVELESIFDKFVQSSKTRSGAGGTGLGLTISREIVEASGGRILARNNAGGGACLEVLLPLGAGAVAPLHGETK